MAGLCITTLFETSVEELPQYRVSTNRNSVIKTRGITKSRGVQIPGAKSPPPYDKILCGGG